MSVTTLDMPTGERGTCVVGGTLELVQDAIGSLVKARESLGDVDIQGLLPALDRLTGLVTGLRSRVLAAAQASAVWVSSGDRNAVAWLGRQTRNGSGEAFRQVRAALTLNEMPAVEAALADGLVTSTHVEVLSKVTANASPLVTEALTSSQGQADVVRLAQKVDARRFDTELRRYTAGLDPARVQHDHNAQQARRFVTLADTADGTSISGLLDRWSGKTLRLALEAIAGQPPADDSRTPGQRRADGLIALAKYTLDTPPTRLAKERPHISVLIDQDTWTALRTGAKADISHAPAGPKADISHAPAGTRTDTSRTLARSGSASDVADRLDGVSPAHDLDGIVVPPSELAALLCDCELSRHVFGANNEPLDLGRTVRLYTGAQRRAILIRDQGCAWPGCTIPIRYAEIHHIAWWDRDNGATSVDNGIALCSYHHHLVHKQDLTITRDTRLWPESTALSHPDQSTSSRKPDRALLSGIARVTYQFRRPDGTTVIQR